MPSKTMALHAKNEDMMALNVKLTNGSKRQTLDMMALNSRNEQRL